MADYRGKPDPKVKIYVETAKEIFEMCCSKAKPDRNGSIYGGVADAITEEFEGVDFFDADIDQKYMSNTNSRIENKIKKNELEIGFSHTYLLRLSRFVGIMDYIQFDKKNKPDFTMLVLFSERPFNFFDLIRVPEVGWLSASKNGWEFKGDAHTKISGKVDDLKKFTMPGDVNPLWIEVTSNEKNGERKTYFADYTSILQPISESSLLFRFFRKKKDHS
jgi:hypothetical protein